MTTRIALDPVAIASFCRRYHIARLALFGSVLREDFGPQSDVDVLVDFESDHVPGFIALHRIESELSELLGGRKVDVVTRKSLNYRIRDRIISSSEVVYPAA